METDALLNAPSASPSPAGYGLNTHGRLSLYGGAGPGRSDQEGSTSGEHSGASGKRSEAAADEDGAGPGVGVMAGRSVCPLSACQVVAVVLASLMAALAVAMLAGGYRAMFDYALHQQLEIREGSTAYDMWKSTPVPLSLRLHVFNLTNPDDFKMGAKPVLQEVGPYVWREYHEKRNVSFHANNTVTYLQERWWVWDQEASGNNTQEDPITTLNAIPVAAAHSMSSSLVQQILNVAFQKVGEQLTVTTTARKVVFDGVKDPLLEWIQENIVAKNGSYHYLLPLLNAMGGGLTKFEKFAWFYKRNHSLTYDGEFNMMTGVDTLANLGKIDNWDGRNHTSFYEPPCNQVKGSAGELFPPHLTRDDLVFFSSDLCMSAKLFYKETVNHGGLSSYRFWGTNHTFANGSTVPGNECYCVDGTCAPMGLLNAESCRMGAPAFVSFPHFYAADPFLVKAVKGLAPDEKKHAFYMDLVPDLGLPAAVSVKLQINLRITPTPNIDLLKNVPDVYLPMLWFEVRADMPPEMVSQMKTLSFFMSSPFAAIWLWVLLLVAGVLIVAGVLLYNLLKKDPTQPPYSRVQES